MAIQHEERFLEEIQERARGRWFLTDRRSGMPHFRAVDDVTVPPPSFLTGGTARKKLLQRIGHATTTWRNRSFIFFHPLPPFTPRDQWRAGEGLADPLPDSAELVSGRTKRPRTPRALWEPDEEPPSQAKRRRRATRAERELAAARALLTIQDTMLDTAASEAREAENRACAAKRQAQRASRAASRCEKRRISAEEEVREALHMPFLARHGRRQPSDAERVCALRYAERWLAAGVGIPVDTVRVAAIRRTSCEAGFGASFAKGEALASWQRRLQIGGSAVEMGKASALQERCGRKSVAECTPDLRRRYREAEKLLGAQATFDDLAAVIKEQGAKEGQYLALSPSSLHRWFIDQGGEEYAETTRPRLTAANKQQRLEYFRRIQQMPRCAPVAWLDEKWFYCSSRRRAKKRLPRADGEPMGVGEKVSEARRGKRSRG